MTAFFKKTALTFVIVTLVISVFVPMVANGAGLVPCGEDKNGDGLVGGPGEACNFNDFVKLISDLIIGAIIIVSVYAAVAFMYAGFQYLTSAGNMEKVKSAHGIFTKVAIGYIIMLSAWALVRTIESALLRPESEGGPKSFLQDRPPATTP